MSDAPLIWAADISKSRSGFAFGVAGIPPNVVSIVGAKLEPEDAASRLFVYMRDLMRVGRPDFAYYEAGLNFAAFQPTVDFEAKTVTNSRGVQSTMDLVEMIGAFKLFCKLASVECRKVYPSTVRKNFLGAGRLERKEAKARTKAMVKLIGWPSANDDEADACAVFHYATCIVAPRLAAPIHPGMFAKAATLAAEKGAGRLADPSEDMPW